jgi:SAM-dependent methyltransferase
LTEKVNLALYREFLEAKANLAEPAGFDIADSDIHPCLKPHQRAIVQWAVRGGRRAIFASFGLGKSLMQIETVRLTRERAGGMGLIVMPLGVRQEFIRDGKMVGLDLRFIRRIEEAEDPAGIYLTNYETIRDSKMDPRQFSVISLDEAACLRGFGGTKTFREMMRLYEGTARYRFVATATPSPNEFIELLAYSAFLDVMDVGQAKTRYFQRDSEHADNLSIRPHKEKEFWLWVASWALFLNKPSELGFSDEGYALPPMEVHWHEVPSDHAKAKPERDGQGRMFSNAGHGVSDAAREKRESLDARMKKLMELRALDPAAHRLIWHDLEDERRAIEKTIPDCRTCYGAQDIGDRESIMIGFSNGEIAEMAGKPVQLGAGGNYQRHCSWAIFLGIGFKFNDFIQAIHRIYRFLQPGAVRIDLIYTEAERPVRQILEEKWARHKQQAARMAEIMREYGLAQVSMANALKRSIGVERDEASGRAFTIVKNDAVVEAAVREADSVDLIVTSIPFSTQYEYTPSYNDFGHTDDNPHFWRQMDFLIPSLLRVLRPGRIAAVHVKDRITPGGVNGLGFQTVQRFSDETASHFEKHGFAFLGRKTIATDVVRENNQTYRLGWSEQCKDGSRMGFGMPEYIMLFRKPPTDRSNGYADSPIVKEKPVCDDNGTVAPFDKRTNWKRPVPGTGYSRAKWQFDAHGFARSDGNRLITSEDLEELSRSVPPDEFHQRLYRLWRDRSTGEPYSFSGHVALAEELDRMGRLPATFMLLPPHSNHPDVWTDVARMRTLNMVQAQKGAEFHLCPLQFDIVERLVTQYSMKGEIVFDPFCGLGTVPYMAVKMGRRGIGVELSAAYYRDAVAYCRSAEATVDVPT